MVHILFPLAETSRIWCLAQEIQMSSTWRRESGLRSDPRALLAFIFLQVPLQTGMLSGDLSSRIRLVQVGHHVAIPQDT